MNKLLFCRYNMDTNRVEARFKDGTTLAIDCIAVEDEYSNTPAQQAELDWLLYHKPLEYAQLVLGGEIEYYPVSYTHLLCPPLLAESNLQLNHTIPPRCFQLPTSFLLSNRK